MSLQLCILASGSSGNCSILRTPAGPLLIDIGIGPRTCAKRLEGTGVGLSDIRAVVLTHLDRDHFNLNWLRTLVRLQIPLFVHHRRLDDLLRLATDYADIAPFDLKPLLQPFDVHPFDILPRLRVRSIPLAHDTLGSNGFVFENCTTRVGYATDLGVVPTSLIEHFTPVDLLALESNYDRQMQLDSSRPWFLKHRIMNGAGHLSNDQALAAIRTILARRQRQSIGLPSHIVLLHRSRQCNCPKLLRNLFSADPLIAPRLTLAHSYERTDWLCASPTAPAIGRQLTLAWT